MNLKLITDRLIIFSAMIETFLLGNIQQGWLCFFSVSDMSHGQTNSESKIMPRIFSPLRQEAKKKYFDSENHRGRMIKTSNFNEF